MSATSERTASISPSSVRALSVRTMRSATSRISPVPMPAVVSAAVPRRRPEVRNGERGSSGMVLRLQVMPARSRTSWASFPVSSSSKGCRSTSSMWLSVPPETSRNPCPASASARAAALATTCAAYRRNSGRAASAKATALAAMTCSSGPPWSPGNTALSIFLARSCPHRMAPPRGPRSVLWVVSVTTSATPTGLGWAPPAMRPAGWAASNMKRAPTESAISRKGTGVDDPGVGRRARHDQGRLLGLGQVGHLVEVDDLAGVRRVGRLRA